MSTIQKSVTIKTICQKNKNRNNYMPSHTFTSIVVLSGTIPNRRNLMKKNTFILNRKILEFITEEELDTITSDWLKLFPKIPREQDKAFTSFISKCQTWGSDSILGIDDYALLEYKEYIIAFHIDIFNGLEYTISSIYKKSSTNPLFFKGFEYAIKLNYLEEVA